MSKKLAVIEIGGSQHIVTEGDSLKVNKLNYNIGEVFEPKVLMVYKDDEVKFNSGRVELRVLNHTKDKKIKVIKFKAKSRYRRKKGHRQKVSFVQVLSIN